MKKTSPVLFTLLCLFLMPVTAGALESDLLGRYWMPDHDGQFEIYEKVGRYFGRVIAYDVEGQLDENNSDPDLRGRPFVGIDMFEAFRFDSESGQWVDGTIYDPENGKTYDCYLWFEGSNKNVLRARGFIGFSVFGRNEDFDRVGSKE